MEVDYESIRDNNCYTIKSIDKYKILMYYKNVIITKL